MLRDVPLLAGLVADIRRKTSESTILEKSFPGGVLSMVGANSGTGFRRISRRVVIFDEVDAYPPSAGKDGDPIKLGEKRSEYYWNRKIIAGSTPLISGASRIEELYEAGDQRRYYVPCPHCGHMDYLVFHEQRDGGHFMRWPEGRPQEACFVCRSCGCLIEESDKRGMIDAGEWRAGAEFRGHASFHIWAAYSLSPNATWANLAEEFLEAKRLGPEKLQTFVNTSLGETWQERGEAPDWERLHARAEPYQIGTVPVQPWALTAGVDVQRDRFVYEVVAWQQDKQSWSVDAGSLWGDTALASTWGQLDALLQRTFPGDGGDHLISMLAIDSGYAAQTVYGWAKNYPASRVLACKGVPGWGRQIVGAPSFVEIKANGKRIKRGYRVWPVGVDVAKSELYGWLRMAPADDGTLSPGYCHFPEHGHEFFRQLTAEHLTKSISKGRVRMSWEVIPNRENHHLDARVLARVAASVLGIDRLQSSATARSRSAPVAAAATTTAPPTEGQPAPAVATAQRPPRQPRAGSFWDRNRSGSGGGWMSRRR